MVLQLGRTFKTFPAAVLLAGFISLSLVPDAVAQDRSTPEFNGDGVAPVEPVAPVAPVPPVPPVAPVPPVPPVAASESAASSATGSPPAAASSRAVGDTPDAADARDASDAADASDADDADNPGGANIPGSAPAAAKQVPARPETADIGIVTTAIGGPTGEEAPPRLPLDPVAAKAYKVLEKHCARCHQTGKLNLGQPARGFGNILRLEQIARQRSLVTPGVPDASPLYTMMLKREMPYDVYQEFSGGPQPTPEEVGALRDWIIDIGGTDEPAAIAQTAAKFNCVAKPFVGVSEMVEKMRRAVTGVAKGRRKDLRFITLTHLHNDCASAREMQAYRQAVVKLLNSLSRAATPIKLATIDEQRTIIPIRLSDFGWSAKTWDAILADYPYMAAPRSTAFDELARETASALPYLRGDWLAHAASRAPLYSRILRQPKELEELRDSLGVNIAANMASGAVLRAGLKTSKIARRNRLIERHQSDDGFYWTTYDFDRERGAGNLLRRPLGPDQRNGFRHQLNAVSYALPNGFPAFFLAGEKGLRLSAAPVDILRDASRAGGQVIAPASCLVCHKTGPIGGVDVIGKEAAKQRGFSKAQRDAIARIYAPDEAMRAQVDKDRAGERNAMRAAGLDPDLTLHGVEIVNALANRYRRDLTLGGAAAELGADAKSFAKRLRDWRQAAIARQQHGPGGAGAAGGGAMAASPARTLLAREQILFSRRLSQGRVPRVLMAHNFDWLLPLANGQKMLPAPPHPGGSEEEKGKAFAHPRVTPSARSFDLAVMTDKSRYDLGDEVRIWVSPAVDCNLTVVNIDRLGRGTLIFPNDFRQDNAVSAGEIIELPGRGAAYKFRMRVPGYETIVAICNTARPVADGITIDFEKQKFANLGSYSQFLLKALAEEVTGRGRKLEKETRGRSRRRSRSRNRRRKRRRETVAKTPPRILPEMQARAAVRVLVE